MVMGKLIINFQKNESRPIYLIPYYNQTKMHRRLRYNYRNLESAGRENSKTLGNMGTGEDFLNKTVVRTSISLRIITCYRIKLKTSVHQREPSKEWRDNLQNGKQFCQRLFR